MGMGDRARLDRALNLDAKKRLVADLVDDESTEGTARLVDMLKEESWYVRSLATNALVARGMCAIPYLLGVVNGQLWFTRAAALGALARIGAHECVAPAVHTLADPNSTVRSAAADALVQLAGDGAARVVAHALARTDERRSSFFFARARALAPAVADSVGAHMHEEAPVDESVAVVPALEGVRP